MEKKCATVECVLAKYERAEAISPAFERVTVFSWNDMLILKKEAEKLKNLVHKCNWTFNDDGYYQTTCGNAWNFESGGILNNGVVFCPYCGGTVLETLSNN
jgi:hypothetical protein